MTSHSNFGGDDGDSAVVVGTVATVGGGVGNRAVVAGNGKVPSASPTDMFSLDSRVRGNDGAVVVGDGDAVDDGAVVVGTVAGGGDGVGGGAVATRDAGLRPLRPSFDGGGGVGNRAVAVGDGHVRPVFDGALRPDDETIATEGNHLKSSFPRTRESRINNSA